MFAPNPDKTIPAPRYPQRPPGDWCNGQHRGLQNRGSRFDSSVPRLSCDDSKMSSAGNDPPVGITAYVLFFLAGIGFGYAAPTYWKWLPILFPIALALGAVFLHGLDGTIVIRLVIALIVTAVGVFVGIMIDAREESRADHPRYA